MAQAVAFLKPRVLRALALCERKVARSIRRHAQARRGDRKSPRLIVSQLTSRYVPAIMEAQPCVGVLAHCFPPRALLSRV